MHREDVAQDISRNEGCTHTSVLRCCRQRTALPVVIERSLKVDMLARPDQAGSSSGTCADGMVYKLMKDICNTQIIAISSFSYQDLTQHEALHRHIVCWQLA